MDKTLLVVKREKGGKRKKMRLTWLVSYAWWLSSKRRPWNEERGKEVGVFKNTIGAFERQK